MNNLRLEKNQDATVWVGNLAPEVEEDVLYELMVQVAPVVHVKLPKDKISKTHQGFAFIELKSPPDAEYAIKVMNGVSLYGRNLRVNSLRNDDSPQVLDVGATLYLGNLDPLIDENFLADTFKSFGTLIVPPQIIRDPVSGESKCHGFLKYDSFESSDKALNLMNNQYLMNKQIKVEYALKKNGKHGERHGDEVERLLAAKAKQNLQQTSRENKKRQREQDEAQREASQFISNQTRDFEQKERRNRSRPSRGRGRSDFHTNNSNSKRGYQQ